MACFNTTKYGFTSILDLMTDVMKEMTGQGMNRVPFFRIVYPSVSLQVGGIAAAGNISIVGIPYKVPHGTKITVTAGTGAGTAGTIAPGNYYVYRSYTTSGVYEPSINPAVPDGASVVLKLVTEPVTVSGGNTPGIVNPVTTVGAGTGYSFTMPYVKSVPPPHTPWGGAGGYVGPDILNPLVTTTPADADDNTNNVPWSPDPASANPIPADSSAGASWGFWILESTPLVDPLADQVQVGAFRSAAGNSSNWRVCFNAISDTKMAIHCATELQLPNTGNIAQLNNRAYSTAPTKTEPAGNLSSFGQDWTSAAPDPAKALSQIWLNRDPDVGSEGAYPMSYCITMTNRGWFFAVWEGSQEEVPEGTFDIGNNPNPLLANNIGNSPFRWVLCQRSVDRITGHVRGGGKMRNQRFPYNPAISYETSRCPVFVVTGMGAPQSFTKFILREVDVSAPSIKKSATIQTEDNPPLLNPYPQQSLTENGDFVVTFLNNLSTPRFRYADELDMLGTVSSEVVGPGSVIEVDVYNEGHGGYDERGVKRASTTPSLGKRVYQALYGTERFGTGMRLMVLTKMGYFPDLDDVDLQRAASDAAEDSHI